jgi:hypothetical protein
VDPLTCTGQNKSIRRLSWLPLHTDLSCRLQQDGHIELYLDDKTHPRIDASQARRLFWPDNMETARDANLVIFPSINSKLNDLISTQGYLLPSTASGESFKLFSQGADFLYGMLFHRTLAIQEDIVGGSLVGLRSALAVDGPVDGPFFSISLVSETSDFADLHPTKSQEIICLELLLSHALGDCRVYVLSDQRLLTMALDCTATTIAYQIGSDTTFFRALALASRARFAFIGARSGLSDLLLESIEYNRRMKQWKLGRDPPVFLDLAKCSLVEPMRDAAQAGDTQDSTAVSVDAV